METVTLILRKCVCCKGNKYCQLQRKSSMLTLKNVHISPVLLLSYVLAFSEG